MRTAIVFSLLLGAHAQAASLSGFAGFSYDAPPITIPVPVLVRPQQADDSQTVSLAPLLDRHLTVTDSFRGAGGTTMVSGTLDLSGDGYLAVTPPGLPARFIKIERGMSGSWVDGVHAYKVGLSVSIFRPRLANIIQIRDASTGQMVWEKRILELFRLTYRAGEPVNLAGRPYRLFYSAKPSLGLCFIYDEVVDGNHEYKFYMVPADQIRGRAATYRMYGGDAVRLQASADLSTLLISR